MLLYSYLCDIILAVNLCYLYFALQMICVYDNISGCSAGGSAPDWGSGGRKFKSCHSDHKEPFFNGSFSLLK